MVWGFREEHGNPLQYSAWRIPWTKEPDGLQSMGLKRVGHNWSDLACRCTLGFRGHSMKLSFIDTSFIRNKVTFKDAQEEWTIWDKPRTNWLHSSHVPLHATRRKDISWRPVQEFQVRCAHPRRRSGCRSPASHPDTGVSAQGPVAATPPCWSPWSHPQKTLTPITTYPSPMRISHHWWTYIQGCVFNDFTMIYMASH